ncbi:hypothetical protein NDU88_010870 [Pleurodeles waltl]|uniref:Uncharacterized protein n=1 Tax=Pleurodeles waltl TaxID=8319 RepID=A0AAV7QYR4_PLEWA|nr:hypothetical protein NDU88_010870 [Pleurodeles waltl]
MRGCIVRCVQQKRCEGRFQNKVTRQSAQTRSSAPHSGSRRKLGCWCPLIPLLGLPIIMRHRTFTTSGKHTQTTSIHLVPTLWKVAVKQWEGQLQRLATEKDLSED